MSSSYTIRELFDRSRGNARNRQVLDAAYPYAVALDKEGIGDDADVFLYNPGMVVFMWRGIGIMKVQSAGLVTISLNNGETFEALYPKPREVVGFLAGSFLATA